METDTPQPAGASGEKLDFIDEAFMLIADNVLKHRITRDGFSFTDKCWLEDYAKARALILNALEAKADLAQGAARDWQATAAKGDGD